MDKPTSRVFYAVASGPYVEKADYRLDTQVIALQQNFLPKPSVIELVVSCINTYRRQSYRFLTNVQ